MKKKSFKMYFSVREKNPVLIIHKSTIQFNSNELIKARKEKKI